MTHDESGAKGRAHDKQRGGFYTPPEVCDFVARWALACDPKTVLEPSCGEGRFLTALARQAEKTGVELPVVTAIERDEGEACKARSSALAAGMAEAGAEITTAGFFKHYLYRIDGQKTFDAVIGNPPYIRYQRFTGEESGYAAALLKAHGIGISRLSNAWMAFLALGADAVSAKGRLGMVLPAELLYTPGSERLRALLAGKFKRIIAITFKKPIFPDLLQDTVLLLADRSPASGKGLSILNLESTAELLIDTHVAASEAACERHNAQALSQNWLLASLSREQRAILDRLNRDPRIAQATELFEVNTGITTGENAFFILNRERAARAKLHARDLKPIVSKAAHVSGLVFAKSDYKELLDSGARVILYDPECTKQGVPLRKSAEQYIWDSEENGLGLTRKCQDRQDGDMWHIPPHSWKPQALLGRHIHKTPAIVLNPAGVQATDAFNKIRFTKGVNGALVAAAFLNSYTLALAEMKGTVYGGGVLSIYPGTVRRLRIPMPGAEHLDLRRLDELFRAGRFEEILNETDEALLMRGLGLSGTEVTQIRSVWTEFRKRRLLKNKKGRARRQG